jgi:hypothetical protein
MGVEGAGSISIWGVYGDMAQAMGRSTRGIVRLGQQDVR